MSRQPRTSDYCICIAKGLIEQVAGIYVGLGNKDEAFRLLEKGYEEHSASMPYLTGDPFWHEMRSDPRYADLLRRVGLPQ